MKRLVRLAALLLASGLIVPSHSAALEVERGRMRLVLHEGLGRFSLYYRAQPVSPEARAEVPLFVDQDPRTSSLSLLVGNKILRLGEGGGFREQAGLTAEGAAFTWQSSQLQVIQEFRFPASQPDAVIVEVSVTNLTAAALNVGLRLCLDTYLGESQIGHFLTDRQREINRETTLLPADGVLYWASTAPPAGSQPAPGLFSLTAGGQVTAPDRVVFANWKRLSEAPWSYETSPTRNFNLVPYSINDSAVCQYYDPAPLPARATRKVVLLLGHMSGLATALAAPAALAQAPTAVPAPAVTEAAPAAAPAPVSSPTEPQTLQEELALLDTLLETLRTHLEAGASLPRESLQEDIRLMQETLSGIKSRSVKY